MAIKLTRRIIDITFKVIMTLALIYIVLCMSRIRPYVVPTGSMLPVIQIGELVIVNENVGYDELEEGDIIVYNQSSSRRIIHRIIKIDDNGITTQGDANPVPDSSIITPENYVGKYIFGIPKLGNILDSMDEKPYNIIYISTLIGLYVVDMILESLEKKKEKV